MNQPATKRLSSQREVRGAFALTATAGALRMIREATTAGSIFSGSDSRVHFGLGDAETVDLQIRWPSGKEQTLTRVSADRIVTVDEDRGVVEP